jgi:hypothetical protein
MGLLVTLLGFAVSFLVRPLGGMVLGPLGDKIGRQKVLFFTMADDGHGDRPHRCAADRSAGRAVGHRAPLPAQDDPGLLDRRRVRRSHYLRIGVRARQVPRILGLMARCRLLPRLRRRCRHRGHHHRDQHRHRGRERDGRRRLEDSVPRRHPARRGRDLVPHEDPRDPELRSERGRGSHHEGQGRSVRPSRPPRRGPSLLEGDPPRDRDRRGLADGGLRAHELHADLPRGDRQGLERPGRRRHHPGARDHVGSACRSSASSRTSWVASSSSWSLPAPRSCSSSRPSRSCRSARWPP